MMNSRKLEEWQQRVLYEASTLRLRCEALNEFLDSDTYNSMELLEQGKLATQIYFMTMYLMVLDDRIESFTEGGQDDH